MKRNPHYKFKTRHEMIAEEPQQHQHHHHRRFILELVSWDSEEMRRTRRVSLTPGQLICKWFDHIFDVFADLLGDEWVLTKPEHEVMLVDNRKDHANKRANYLALNGAEFNLLEMERWQVICDGHTLAFRLDRLPGHEGPLFIPVVQFEDCVAETEQCRSVVYHDAGLPISYPEINHPLRIKWEEMEV